MSVAPPLGKELASTEKKTRDKAVNDLRKFLATTGEKPMSDLEMAKLWKGLFYCFWLSDKPLVQQELSTSLADLLLVIPTQDASFHFLRGFWQAIVREWSGLDYLRIDKYYMLVRKFVNAAFRLLIREQWSLVALAEYTDIMTGKGGPLNREDRKIPTSLVYHLADIQNEELNKAMSSEPTPPPVPLVPLFKPFFQLDAVATASATHGRLQSSLISPLLAALLAHSAPPEKARNYRTTVASPTLSSGDAEGPRRKRARIEPPELPLPSICLNARLGDDGEEKDAEERESTDEAINTSPLPPATLRKGLLKAIFDIASASDTKEANRRKMYREWKEATELAEEMAIIDPDVA
ncbi:hypothetical protein M408DRAFT_327284 [Serendipita vermifera MAFF 305830]|uniref:Nop52-domain-containing protein n=1 Tax=Serendipita vermifera MAFF 305830 TaxID=933852 RepID=A0A0C2XSG0_SERVB|nr:hypothetical protein M408DRAFT_327284 [Serendipita vermifera MAFF 305830]